MKDVLGVCVREECDIEEQRSVKERLEREMLGDMIRAAKL